MSLINNRLISVSQRVFQLLETSQLSQKFGLKACRVVTGCLVAGCLVTGCLVARYCFSKKPEEEPLLNEAKTDNDVRSPVYQRNDGECSSMKRSSEIVSTVSQDISKSEITNVKSKKLKIDDDNKNVYVKKYISETKYKSLSPINKDYPKAKSGDHSKEKKSKQPERLKPNYFVAVQISNHEIHKNLKNLQDHILENESNLINIMQELKTLHITLMVMHIADLETHSRAMAALKSIHREYDKEMSDNPLQLQFKGLGHFGNKVLFAKVLQDNSYKRLCDLAGSVKEHFAANAIHTTDKRSKFTPHLTVAKIDFQKNKGIKKINPDLYKDYVDDYFGSQTIESIQLLSMTRPRNEEGYYSGDEIYFSGFDPNNSMKALSEMLEVEKKKNDVKETIRSLMKEKLK